MRSVGVTATRHGTTPRQRDAVGLKLRELFEPGAEFHHGDCVGGVQEVAAMARNIGYRLISHPPADGRLRAFVKSDEVRPARPFLSMNRDIVDSVGFLAVVPRYPEGDNRSIRSGTWQTKRYADHRGVPYEVFLP